MRRLVLLLLVCLAMLLLFSCSDQTPVTNNNQDASSLALVQRPNFVDNRPQAEVQQVTMTSAMVDLDAFAKKPPHPHDPPPDTTSGDPNPNPAHKFAYVVGISDYEGTANDLQYPDDDAQAIRNMLQGEGFTIQSDLNGNATADNIEAGLQWLVSQASPGDEIAFYYSGHGAKAQGYGSSLISTDLWYLTHDWVMQYFNAADCSKKLVAIDACVIGDFHQDCENGTMMATASNKTNSYDAPDLHHGAWTYYFLDGAESQGLIYAEDVSTYAEDGMADWAKIWHVRVSPKHTDKYDGDFDM